MPSPPWGIRFKHLSPKALPSSSAGSQTASPFLHKVYPSADLSFVSCPLGRKYCEEKDDQVKWERLHIFMHAQSARRMGIIYSKLLITKLCKMDTSFVYAYTSEIWENMDKRLHIRRLICIWIWVKTLKPFDRLTKLKFTLKGVCFKTDSEETLYSVQ